MSFIVLSLPRSRSAWLSQFLSYEGREVSHDLAIECGSVAEFIGKFLQREGSCETGAVLGWRVIRKELPATRLVVVKRPLAEVYASLLQLGIEADQTDLIHKYDLLQEASRAPGVLSVNYDDLSDWRVCKEVFEFCLAVPFDEGWWRTLAPINIQVDLPIRFYKLLDNRENIARLKAEIADRLPSCLN